MSEWEEKLNTLLSDPDAMAQVMNVGSEMCIRDRSCAVGSPSTTAAGRSDGRSFVAARRH